MNTTPTSYAELFSLLEAEEAKGVATTKMYVLRDIYGASKLGVNVVASISDELHRRGFGHYPEDLPTNQNDSVRIYLKGSSIGRFVEALTGFRGGEDEKIREIIRSDDILNKIRNMVSR